MVVCFQSNQLSFCRCGPISPSLSNWAGVAPRAMDKVVELERAAENEGQLGSFGFSIMGGYGTKFPSCVCEVDSGGPADRTNKVGGCGQRNLL